MSKSRNVRSARRAIHGQRARFDDESKLSQDSPPAPLRDEIGLKACIRKTMALVNIATIACKASYEKPTDVRSALGWDGREKLTRNLFDERG
jgi:hypothetical protein